MKPRVYVLSDRRKPWDTSYFVLYGAHIVARGLTWEHAMNLAVRAAA